MRGFLTQAKQMVPVMIKMIFGTAQSKIDKHLDSIEEKSRYQLEESDDVFVKLLLESFPRDFSPTPLKKNSSGSFMDLFRVEYESVKISKEINESFHTYLLKEKNYSYEIMEEINNLKFNTLEEQNQIYCKIVDLYINEKSSKHLDLAKKDQEHYISFYQNAKDLKLENPTELLLPLKHLIETHLRVHEFPKFIRNKNYQLAFHKNTLDSKIMIPYDPIRMTVEDSYFTKLNATKQDIEFGLKLLKDNFEWELIPTNIKLTNVYVSKTNYFSNSNYFKGCNIIKGEILRPHSIHKCLANMKVESFTKAISPLSTYKCEHIHKDILKNLCPNEEILSSIQILEHNIQLPFPLTTPRRIISTASFIYLEKEELYLFIMKPYLGKLNIKDYNIDWNNKSPVKGDSYEGYYGAHFHYMFMKKVSENETQITHIKFFDLRGYLQSTNQFIPFITKALFSSYHGEMEKLVVNDTVKEGEKDPFIILASEIYDFNKSNK